MTPLTPWLRACTVPVPDCTGGSSTGSGTCSGTGAKFSSGWVLVGTQSGQKISWDTSGAIFKHKLL